MPVFHEFINLNNAVEKIKEARATMTAYGMDTDKADHDILLYHLCSAVMALAEQAAPEETPYPDEPIGDVVEKFSKFKAMVHGALDELKIPAHNDQDCRIKHRLDDLVGIMRSKDGLITALRDEVEGLEDEVEGLEDEVKGLEDDVREPKTLAEPKEPRGSMVHELKCHDTYFEEIWNNRKTFEIRKNDRDFRARDYLSLYETKPSPLGGPGERVYTGRWIYAQVTYVTDYAQKDGYVVMGLCICNRFSENTKHRTGELA